MRLTDDGITSNAMRRGIRWEVIGFPERCKECDKRYKRAKRAREAILRLEYVRMTKTMDARWLIGDSHEAQPTADAERWKYLKFVTMTWPIKWTTEEKPDFDAHMRRYVKAREKLSTTLDVLGGTDVMECVSTKSEDGKLWKHNVHFHGVWVMPWHPIEAIDEAFTHAGVGRQQIRVIREKEYECKYTGKIKIQSAVNRATAYLAKYLTKEILGNRRRIAWGEMRRWKEAVPHFFRCEHIKTTYSVGRCSCFQD